VSSASARRLFCKREVIVRWLGCMAEIDSCFHHGLSQEKVVVHGVMVHADSDGNVVQVVNCCGIPIVMRLDLGPSPKYCS
jgi:hypothetical protein